MAAHSRISAARRTPWISTRSVIVAASLAQLMDGNLEERLAYAGPETSQALHAIEQSTI
jgi:hypothetical protein